MNRSAPLYDPLPEQQGPGELLPTEPTRRAGSVNLRAAGADRLSDESPLDPANQSLADALKIMLRLLQVGMAILAGLYCLSGLQSVREGEQAIRLLFGARQGEPMDPGLRISTPFPLGEMIRVDRGLKDYAIDKDFWVYIPDNAAEGISVEKLAPSASLKPDQGGTGSVLTADGNIAHTKWRVGVRREDVAMFAQNVLPTDEERLVRAAVKRGVVHACSQVTIDELLKQSSSGAASVASRAKAVAQRTLDAFKSGLVIDQLTLDQTIAPLAVRSDFAKVQAAVANSIKIEDQAGTEARNLLSAMAGESVPYVLDAINEYERALSTKDEKAAAAGLARIDALLQGEKVTIDGAEVEGKVGGLVTSLLSDAKRDRATAVAYAKSALASYRAKLDQFTQNPSVMLQQEWSRAVSMFMSRDTVQTLYVPSDLMSFRLQISPDPELMRAVDRTVKERERSEAERKRMEQLRKDRFKTETQSNEISG